MGKKLKCFAILDGLPGAPDPVPVRNFTLTPEQRENPIVKDMKLKKIKGGKIQKKHLDRVKDRKSYLEKKEAMKEEAKARRRTKFDFDLWGNEEKDEKLPSKDWVNTEAMIHSAIGTSQHVPRFSKDRTISTGTKVAAVEVPDSVASYNPSLEEHQELLWKAAMVEIDKEKEQQKIERLTWGMFPSRDKAPTAESRMKEMSEGIVELGEDHEKEDEQLEDDTEKVVVGNKPKTRRQLRDKRKKMFEDQRKEREKDVKIREIEISRVKSIKKQLKSEESKTLKKQEKRKVAAEEKLLGPVRLSNYKYEPQEIEIKLSDELTGNLRNLKQEGSF